MQHDNNLHIDGKEVILENLRHFCINEFAEEEEEGKSDEYTGSN